jgi:hypothetical protein
MRVLIIPEDFRKDQYILKPILSAMFAHLGKPRARVSVCQNPLLHGVSQALAWQYIEPIITRYHGMYDMFILCVDRDGQKDRRARLDNLEQQAANIVGESRFFVAENAWQELEVWVIAGHDLPAEWNWQHIRQEIHPKEHYFVPLAQQFEVLKEPHEGREQLGRAAARRYRRIRQLCPEDIANLEDRIRTWIERG